MKSGRQARPRLLQPGYPRASSSRRRHRCLCPPADASSAHPLHDARVRKQGLHYLRVLASFDKRRAEGVAQAVEGVIHRPTHPLREHKTVVCPLRCPQPFLVLALAAGGGLMAACRLEVHRRVPWCLLGFFDRSAVGGPDEKGLQAWFDRVRHITNC